MEVEKQIKKRDANLQETVKIAKNLLHGGHYGLVMKQDLVVDPLCEAELYACRAEDVAQTKPVSHANEGMDVVAGVAHYIKDVRLGIKH